MAIEHSLSTGTVELWSAVASPHPGPRGWGFLMGISGSGIRRNVWAVGMLRRVTASVSTR